MQGQRTSLVVVSHGEEVSTEVTKNKGLLWKSKPITHPLEAERILVCNHHRTIDHPEVEETQFREF